MTKKQTTEDNVNDVVQDTPPSSGPVEPETDWKGKYIRALADYQNLVRRTAEEKSEDRKFAAQIAIETILPSVSLLKTAQQHLKNEGLDLAMKEFSAALAKMGVEIVDPMGEAFDPEIMECVHAEQGGTVVTAVPSPGFRMHGKLIKPAKVVIGKKMSEEKKETVN